MKKLLICLTVLFSAFLFTNKISAMNFTYNGVNYTDEWIYNKLLDKGYDLRDYEYIAINSYITGSFYIEIIAWNNMYPTTNKISNNNKLQIKYNTSEAIIYYYYMKTGEENFYGPGSGSGAFYLNFVNTNILPKGTVYGFNDLVYNGTTYTFDEFDWSFLPPTTYNITLHLNGGIADDNNWVSGDGGSYLVGMKYEDYTITVPGDNLISYLREVYVIKEPMQFVGWYYDEKLTQKVNSTDTIDSDQHFYAKYQYKNVEDFLNNTTFNSYTFDENYQYAVISLNNQENRDIYLGLDIMSHNLEVYKYDKNNNITIQGSTSCLTPIYSKENKYYYQLSDSLDYTYEVLILEKEKLKGNYNFLLSDNAYVSYTNDLKNLIIKDDHGNDLTIDIEDSYNYSQDNLLNSENDLLEIFKDLINNKDNNVFSYFNQVWNYMKTNKLFTYFMTLIIGSLIILIIKSASR